MQFSPISTKALASVLLLSSLAVAVPTAAKEGSITLPEGVVRINAVLDINAAETCNPIECSCENKSAGKVLCVVPLGGDKTKCTNMCAGINRST
ncbi:hypothetical protein PG995_011014 [Apiospora arundinis]